MNSNINLIAFGTFGNPHGFRQTFFIGNGELSKNVKTFDLNTNAIKLFPNSRVYAIRKEYVNGFNTISYVVYSYAKEQNSDRSGTFIGSAILFTNEIADESVIVNQLNEVQNNLINNNVQNDIIIANHSDKLSVIKPSGFEKTEFNLKPVDDLNFLQISNKNLVVFCDTTPGKLQTFYKRSLDLLNIYDNIFFTDSREVAEFVIQKGVFKLIQSVGDIDDLEKELQVLYEERKRKIDLSVSEFDKERQKLEEDRKRLIEEYKQQIDHNEKLHQENRQKIEEFYKDLESLNKSYTEFSEKINQLANQLRSGAKFHEVRILYNENKRLFIEGINQLKKPSLINRISKKNIKSSLKVEPQYDNYEIATRQIFRRDEVEADKINLYKVASFVLLFLLICTWVYFIFIHSKEESKPFIVQEKIQEKPGQSPEQEIATIIPELQPTPNSNLNENDFRLVAKKLKYNTSLEAVTKIIFVNNPTEIKNIYTGQEHIYADHIVKLNKNCFEEKEGVYVFTKDTLRHIPSYKK